MATDEDIKPADLNKDGKVTPKEREKFKAAQADNKKAAAKTPGVYEPAKDTITAAEMETRYGFAKRVVWENPELRRLYQQAIKQEWTDDEFEAKLRSSKWYQGNAEYARKAWTAERLGGADWKTQVEEARLAVQERATEMGSEQDTATLDALALRYLREGWGEDSRKNLLDKALADSLETGDNGYLAGESGDMQENLMEMARKNGLKFNDAFYTGAARSVGAGLMTEEDFMRDMRQQAATLWSPWSDKIMAGLDAEDLMSGYKNMLAQTMEVDADSIGLDDPRLMKAVMTPDGQPMGLYDFQLMLRKDPAWMETKQATDDVSSIGMDILRKFGFQA